jgi:hypothetical protein
MSIDALPPAPAATDPVDTFDAKAFAFNAALQNFRMQANATADTMQINADILAAVLLGMALPDYAGTSASSFAIGTGSKTFATQTGKLWTVGQIVVISNGANLMRGSVADYSAGNLTVNVTSISGSGTFSSWTIGLSFDGLALAKSGANNDITSLLGLTSPIPSANTVGKLESLPNPTLSANAMTLPASTHALDFRSPTLSNGLPSTVSGTAAALVIPAGATLGTVSAVQSTIVEVIINNAGTLEKAVVNLAGGNDLFETGVISTTAISAGATAANVFYSTTARTNVPYRVVRTITSIQATAGQWATNPSAIQVAGGKALDAMQSFGYGQTWQDVTGSRVLGTTYYNTTGKPIQVQIRGVSPAGATAGLSLSINGVAMPFSSQISSNPTYTGGIVPPGGSYVGNANGCTLGSWVELR